MNGVTEHGHEVEDGECPAVTRPPSRAEIGHRVREVCERGRSKLRAVLPTDI
ncbi:MAG: hypothetical protein PSX80_15600 [bacterium]|nr:hypothetical protein [bacterium]